MFLQLVAAQAVCDPDIAEENTAKEPAVAAAKIDLVVFLQVGAFAAFAIISANCVCLPRSIPIYLLKQHQKKIKQKIRSDG